MPCGDQRNSSDTTDFLHERTLAIFVAAKQGKSMTDEAIETSILIVGYNSRRYLEKCLSSIPGASKRNRWEVIFVNNGTDNSVPYLAEAFPDVEIVPSRGNVGFAAANNLLARRARGKWLLLLNPDTQLEPDAIDLLLDAAQSYSDFQILAGATYTGDPPRLAVPPTVLPNLWDLTKGVIGIQPKPTDLAGQGVVDVESVNGGFMLVNAGMWERLGGMDEGFFLYTEEVDFCKRCLEAGGKIGFVGESRIHHDLGSGTNLSPERIRFMATGSAHYYRKHFARPYADLCVLMLWLSCLARFIIANLFRWKDERYGRMARAFAFVALKPRRWFLGYRSPGADPRRN